MLETSAPGVTKQGVVRFQDKIPLTELCLRSITQRCPITFLWMHMYNVIRTV